MKKPTTKNLPAKSASRELVTQDDFDTGRSIPEGFENVTTADLIIPRLTILQELSPQTKPKKPEYIKGAAPGMFCDVALGQTFKELLIIPVFFARIYLEWAPRNSGGGLVRNYGTDGSILDKCERDEQNKATLKNGNYISEVAQYFCLNMSAKGRRSFLPLSSTGLTDSRKWMMKMNAERVERPDGSEYQPPMYYRSWKINVNEKSKNDNDWFGWDFQPGPTIIELDKTKKLLHEAKEFYAQAQLGLVRGDVSVEESINTGYSNKDGAM